MTVIEIRPQRNGRKAFEASGVEPVFPTKDDAISYAQTRVRFRTGDSRRTRFKSMPDFFGSARISKRLVYAKLFPPS